MWVECFISYKLTKVIDSLEKERAIAMAIAKSALARERAKIQKSTLLLCAQPSIKVAQVSKFAPVPEELKPNIRSHFARFVFHPNFILIQLLHVLSVPKALGLERGPPRASAVFEKHGFCYLEKGALDSATVNACALRALDDEAELQSALEAQRRDALLRQAGGSDSGGHPSRN